MVGWQELKYFSGQLCYSMMIFLCMDYDKTKTKQNLQDTFQVSLRTVLSFSSSWGTEEVVVNLCSP
jgi:hypothetical protein